MRPPVFITDLRNMKVVIDDLDIEFDDYDAG